MFGWWSSLESVNRFSLTMQICAVVFTVLVGICTYASILAGKRIAELTTAKNKAWQDRVDEAEKKAESASRQAEEAHRRTAPRVILNPEAATNRLRQYAGQKVTTERQ